MSRTYHAKGCYKITSKEDNVCFFCKNLTDVIWDYTNGPYLFICEKVDGDGIDLGLEGKCPHFEEAYDGRREVEE